MSASPADILHAMTVAAKQKLAEAVSQEGFQWPSTVRESPESEALSTFLSFKKSNLTSVDQLPESRAGMLMAMPLIVIPPCEARVRPAADLLEATGVSGYWVEWPGVDVSPTAATLIYIHGGALIMGAAKCVEGAVTHMSKQVGVRVLNIDYPLAPEAKVPEQVNVCIKPFEFLVGLGVPPERIAIAGESAGGALTCLVTQALLARRQQRPRCIGLISPWMDITSREGNALLADGTIDDPLFERLPSLDIIRQIVPEGVSVEDPSCNPIYGDFDGFPDAYVATARGEAIAVDTENFAKRARAVNVSVTVDYSENRLHANAIFNTPEGHEQLARLCGFLRSHLRQE